MQPTDHIARAPTEAETETPFDFSQLVEALIELNIARKNVLFYPEHHSQVKKSIDLAHDCLSSCLQASKELALIVAKESFSVGGFLLDPSNSVLQELKAVFKSKNIAVLTFRQGLSREELAGFLLRIARSAETADSPPTQGAPPQGESATDNIRIQAVDYSKFAHTEEALIKRKSAPGRKPAHDSVWNDFVHGLAAGILLDPNGETPTEFVRRSTPSAIAGRLNRTDTVETELLKKYEDVIKDHLLGASWTQDRQPDSGWTDIYRCFEQLKPELRHEFLAVTYDQLAAQKEPESLEPLLSRLPPKLMVEMLQAATRGERQLSPSLLNFVGKMLNARCAGGSSQEYDAVRRWAYDVGALAAPEMSGALFKRENFDAYVTSDYESTLKHMVRFQTPPEAENTDRIDVQACLKTLGEDRLAEHIAEVSIALMAGRLDADLYREIAEQMVGLANDLAKASHIGLIARMQQLFQNHSGTEPGDACSAAARAALDQLGGPGLLRTLRVSLEASGRWAEPGVAATVLELGPHAVPEALHLYLQRHEPQREEWLAALISRYPQQLLKEISKRLQLHAGAHTVELLSIFERLGDPACSDCVRPFLRHPDDTARFQALKVLLRFNDADAVSRLRELLDSRRSQDFWTGLDLAEQYSVAGVAADLAKRLKTRFLVYRSDVIRNEKILLALENFGYRLAASDLERLNRIRFTFYPQQLARMKSVVSAMLQKRPPAARPDRGREAILRHDANAQ